MLAFSLTLPTPAENLALDEALLDELEESDSSHNHPGFLRFWESPTSFVVLGYGNKVEQEVNTEECRRLNVPVLRRCSGGGTVLQGPGSMNYAVVLRIDSDPALQSISDTNCFVMKRNREALTSALGRKVSIEGFTDLALDGLKFSGNAQRRKRHWLLFHGTFLLANADLGLIERCLRLPPRQPEYRHGRTHTDFLTRLNLDSASIQTALKRVWGAVDAEATVLKVRVSRLAEERYGRDEWNLRT